MDWRGSPPDPGHAKESRRASKASSALCQAARKRSASGTWSSSQTICSMLTPLSEATRLSARKPFCRGVSTKVLATGPRTGPAPPGGERVFDSLITALLFKVERCGRVSSLGC